MNPYINIPKFIRNQLGEDKRTPLRLSWLEALLETGDITLNEIEQFRLDKLREVAYSGQTIQLERMLNDFFDIALRRIYIRHNIFVNDVLWLEEEEQASPFLYLEIEYDNGYAGEAGTSGILNQEYWNLEGENPGEVIGGTSGTSGGLHIDFEVVVPIELSSFETKIRANLNRYVQAGKVYGIVYV